MFPPLNSVLLGATPPHTWLRGMHFLCCLVGVRSGSRPCSTAQGSGVVSIPADSVHSCHTSDTLTVAGVFFNFFLNSVWLIHVCMARRLPALRRQVYQTGMSNGGDMAYRIACEASDLIAAVYDSHFPCPRRHFRISIDWFGSCFEVKVQVQVQRFPKRTRVVAAALP